MHASNLNVFFKKGVNVVDFSNKSFKSKVLMFLKITCFGVLLFSLFMIFYIYYDSYKSDNLNKALREEVYKQESIYYEDLIYKFRYVNRSAGIKSNKVLPKFNSLIDINKDIVGWINIPGTRVDYPVLKAKDNTYYLNHDVNKNKSKSGSIFMDFRNDIKKSDLNIIIYGHNMKNGSMFHDLVKYKNKEFFERNPIINFDTLYDENKWEVFSVYVTDTDFNYLVTEFETSEEYIKYLNNIKSRSMFKKDITLGINDRILTLSTCSYEFNNARLVVHAKLIRN